MDSTGRGRGEALEGLRGGGGGQHGRETRAEGKKWGMVDGRERRG